MNEVGQLIDANIVDFIGFVDSLTFADCNGTKKLLEAELGRTRLGREKLLKEMESTGADKVKEYVTTFVVEQKIIDRLEITESIKRTKGVDLSIFKPN